MLGTVISNLRQMVSLILTQMYNVTTLIRTSLSKLIGVLTELKTQFVVYLKQLFQCVQIESSINRFRALLTILASSIKAELLYAALKVTHLGLQLLITVRKMLQLALQVLLQTKDRLVAYIKLVQLRFSVTSLAQTPMVILLIQGGEKLLGTVRQLLQRATQLLNRKQ